MCGGSAPKVEAPKPAPPPPPPPPPPPAIVPVQTAADSTPTQSGEKKRRSRDSLRIDLTNTAGAASSGLNIPT